MPDPQPDQSLHLPSLGIKNFRGIDELTIPRLGRVTLLAGKNGVGKTTVLDAVRVYATGGDRSTLVKVLYDGDENFKDVNVDRQEESALDWHGLFHGRCISPDRPITIGPAEQGDFLQVRFAPPTAQDIQEFQLYDEGFFSGEDALALETIMWGVRRMMRPHSLSIPPRITYRANRTAFPPDIVCNELGPGVPDNPTIERYLNDIALTPHEERAVGALNLVMEAEVQRVAMVDSGVRDGPRSGRRVLVKAKGQDVPVPLRSLGDGAVRIFGVALALAASSGGFLLIDEAENGIHHSVQPKFWKMVLQTAQRNNVQVIATTHSWDCVKGFAEASAELDDVDGVLVRLERPDDRLLAVEYSERNLKAAAKYGIEVR